MLLRSQCCPFFVATVLVLLLSTICRISARPSMKSIVMQAVNSEDTKEESGEESEENFKSHSRYDSILAHLQRYGYISSSQPSLDELVAALRTFQAVAGVPITGKMDADTTAATRQPRCVRPDMNTAAASEAEDDDDLDPDTPRSRRKRFVLAHQSKWATKHFTAPHELKLTWFVSKYTNDIPKHPIRNTIKKAFDLWASQVDLKQLPHVKLQFEEAPSQEQADINILWTEGDHGDDWTFDGRGVDNENVLAHTFFPDYKPHPLNGDIHFDDAEKWSVDPSRNTFFPYVLAHEIGHALGLQHSRNEKALMHPHYKNVPLDNIRLHKDDQCGVNWNYAGSSNFCLFVWLMAEIVPIHTNQVAHSASATAAAAAAAAAASQAMSFGRRSEKFGFGKAELMKYANIPQCTAYNSVREQTEHKLRRQLHFPPDEARIYSEISCRFLDGLHVYRNKVGQTSDSLEDEFNGVSEYAPVDENKLHKMFRRAIKRHTQNKKSVLDRDFFSTHFFDDFLDTYYSS